MTEMPRAGERHRHAVFVRRRDDFRVAHGTTRLDRRGRACFRRSNQTVRERKKSIAANYAAGER